MGKPDAAEWSDRKPMNHSTEKESQKVQIIKIKALSHEGKIKFINIFYLRAQKIFDKTRNSLNW